MRINCVPVWKLLQISRSESRGRCVFEKGGSSMQPPVIGVLTFLLLTTRPWQQLSYSFEKKDPLKKAFFKSKQYFHHCDSSEDRNVQKCTRGNTWGVRLRNRWEGAWKKNVRAFVHRNAMEREGVEAKPVSELSSSSPLSNIYQFTMKFVLLIVFPSEVSTFFLLVLRIAFSQ